MLMKSQKLKSSEGFLEGDVSMREDAKMENSGGRDLLMSSRWHMGASWGEGVEDLSEVERMRQSILSAF